ncbi:MAG: DUF2339 domain-containing protein [Rhodobacteraceae bacterium]|nr:DUF2339 domain-containing protein [Paracoccaceae bacterium]
MEFLAVLAIAFLVGLPVAVIVLIVQVVRLRARVAALELAAPAPAAPIAGRDQREAPSPVSAPEPAAAEPAPATGPGISAEPAKPTEPAGPWGAAASGDGRPDAAPKPEAPSPAGAGLRWLAANWFYAVSALSLVLAGVFLVQYGIERGLLTPWMRVAAAFALGVALITAGEVIRRRAGDEGETAAAHLPSTFSAAGIVVIYAAILAARSLYGLVGAGSAFAGLVIVGAVAIVFGWFYGRFLAAAGLLGAAAAPWLVGGDPGTVDFLSAYYAALGGVGLAVDAVRRWGWVSALAIGLAYLGGRMAFEAGAGLAGHAGMLAALALMAVALPRLEIWPSHPGPALLPALVARRPAATIPPVRIAWAAMVTSVALILGAVQGAAADEALFGAVVLAGLGVLAALWTRAAPGLFDLALPPALAFLALLVLEPLTGGGLHAGFAAFVPAEAPETAPPATVSILVALGAALAGAMALRGGPQRRVMAAAAAALAVAVPVVLELFWVPTPVIGAGRWAFHAIALAALATLAAERAARADAADHARAAFATLAALTLVALALFVMLASTALTVALAALIALAAALDRRFDLPETALALHLGTATILWRLIVDPGLDAHMEDLPLAEVVLAHAAALAALALARVILRPGRARAAAVLETGFITVAAILASILVHRLVLTVSGPGAGSHHWEAALHGLAWTAAALAQFWRAGAETGGLRALRKAAAALLALPALLGFLAALIFENPYFAYADVIAGPQPFDSLAIAYALPALVFAVLAARPPLPRLAPAFAGVAALFGAVWLALSIRRFWQGAVMESLGFADPELYSYTVALLAIGGAAFYQAIAARRPVLRRIATGLIGLAVLKVFLVDAADLAGLLRVFSFLALGLALAGLAWLNRWAALRSGASGPAPGQGL